MPLFFAAHEFLAISHEGRLFSASIEGLTYSCANAVLIDSLPKKILFNFFMKFNRPVALTRGFTTREEAFSWLILHSTSPQ
jgi:hypothetical protein